MSPRRSAGPGGGEKPETLSKRTWESRKLTKVTEDARVCLTAQRQLAEQLPGTTHRDECGTGPRHKVTGGHTGGAPAEGLASKRRDSESDREAFEGRLRASR